MAKEKNVLLVYPEVPKNTYWSFQYALQFTGKKSAMPPLGLITIAAYFPAHYRLKLVDLNIEPLKEADILWADQVYVSAMIVQKASFARVVETCNRLNTTVVAGGPYPTSSHEEIEGVDCFVLGEVENCLPDIIAALETGRAKRVYPPAGRPSMKTAKVPRFDLLKLKAYASMAIQYSRGCPFKCEFCDIWKVYGNRPRLKSPSGVLSELDTLYASGWRGPVFIVDDNFIGNRKKVRDELLPALFTWQRSHGFAFRFFTEASINMATDPELLEAMRAAGFDEVFIGIETPSREGLAETGKKQNLKTDMAEAVETIQRHGMEVMAGFIVGFDSDTDDIFDRQIEFIQKTGIPQAMVGLLTALPGTELHRRLLSQGRLLNAADGNNTHCHAINFIPRMDEKKLKNGYRRILSTIYDKRLKNYFERCSRLLDRIGDTPQFARKIRFDEIRGLAASLPRQLVSPYGLQYLKFLARSLVRNRVVLSEAVRLGVIGHHFHTITSEMIEAEKVASYLDETYAHLCARLETYSSLARGSYQEKRREIVQLLRHKKRVLNRIRQRIDSLHVDFRRDLVRRYRDLSERLQRLSEPLEAAVVFTD
ncbi:MAG: B12-binding domain-containing radical SAM protein [Deltaproteobacteria bacterium]|nr:B12-binding domain-containing radical SAM protein [Deltaproteobacteria bacterium]